MTASPSITLTLLPDAPDADGEPRAGLLVPAAPGALNRRPLLRIFATVGAAVEAKRVLEGGR